MLLIEEISGEGDGPAASLAEHFHVTDPGLVRQIDAELTTVRLKAGETLIRQGDRTSDVYLVLGGRLRATVQDEAGVSRPVGEIGRGETIGELAMITGEPRMATVTALRDTVLARLGREAFGRILASSPDAAMATLKLVVERSRQLETSRRPVKAPAVVALVPITPGVDLDALSRRLVDTLGDIGEPATLLTAGELARMSIGELGQRIETLERARRMIFLALDGGTTAATRLALTVADEVLLLADAGRSRVVSEVEAACIDPGLQEHPIRQTLVLLHPADTRAPRDTAGWLDRRRVDRHLHIRPDLPADLRRLARVVAGRAIGLVLAGGAARAIAHVGVLRALAEHGISADFVGGTSMGAIIAAWQAMEVGGDDLLSACDRAFGHNPSSDYNLIPLVSLVRGGRTLQITLNEVLLRCGREIDAEDTWRTYFCIASDFTGAAEAILQRGRLHRNIMASYAIPGIFPPQIIDGRLMYDGGTFNNFPVDAMERLGAGRIIGVDMLAGQRRPLDLTEIPAPAALLLDRFRNVANRRYKLPSMPETLLTACFITSGSRQQATANRADLHIRPKVKNIGMLDWSKRHDAVRQGYEHASRQLAAMSPEELDRFR
jgi:NTE family protein